MEPPERVPDREDDMRKLVVGGRYGSFALDEQEAER
jgi:hypothetical protein